MPSSVGVDVDPVKKRGTLSPTNEEGSQESTPMDLAPEAVKQGKKLESSSSKKVRGAGAENTSDRLTDAPDTDFASTSPKKNARVQIAPSDGKQKDANCRDNRYGYRPSYDNNQGGFNNQGRRQRKRQKKKKDAVPVPTRNYDSPLGSEFEDDDDLNNDSDLEKAQAGATYGKKRCEFNELKSSEGGKEKEEEEGEDKDRSEINAGIGAKKIPCGKKDVLSLIPMAHRLSLNADTGGKSTLPKSSLAIKEELMQKKGLPLKKAIDPTVTRKKVQLIMPNPQRRIESQASPYLFQLAAMKLILDHPGRSALHQFEKTKGSKSCRLVMSPSRAERFLARLGS